MVKIAILDCAILDGPTFSKYDSVGALVTAWLQPHLPDGARLDTHAIALGDPFPEFEAYDGFILPGSEHGVYDDTPWMVPLRDYLLRLKANGKPLLGICFGHQMMAHTFGGRAAKAGLGMCAGSRCWTVGDQTFDAHVLHQDQVLEVPPGARVIGGSDYCPNGVIAYDFPALSMQFHPEYTREFVGDVVDLLEDIDELDADAASMSKASLDRDVRSDLFGRQAADFLSTGLTP